MSIRMYTYIYICIYIYCYGHPLRLSKIINVLLEYPGTSHQLFVRERIEFKKIQNYR